MRSIATLVLGAVLLVACAGEPPAPLQSSGAAGPSEATPTSLRIVCTPDGGTRFPQGTAVAAQPDGVHLEVENHAGEGASINGFALDVDEGVTARVVGEPPGRQKVACWPFSRHRGPEPAATQVRIADPEGHWVETELDCPVGVAQGNTIVDYAAGAKGETGTPTELARGYAGRDMREADFVPAGYPESADGKVVIARQDGNTVGAFRFAAKPGGRWLFTGEESCS